MKKIHKFIIKLSILIVLLIIPFLTIIIITENTPNQYSKTYLAEFNDKYKLLNDTDEKKIIFVGGSSLPFGLRSDLMEEEMKGYKVVNFGLYATLGTKFMMDMSKSNINKGDIVILSPELNEQTYSLYFNPSAVLQACDGFSTNHSNLSINNRLSLFYNYFKFSKEKMSYSKNNNAPDPIGIYRHDSFNQYGDINVNRPNNIMNNGVDSTMDINISKELLNNKFVNYINNYCNYVRMKGAKIFFSFSPCNELAIMSSKNKRNDFQEEIDLKLKCDRLMNIEDAIIDYRYFYDTNFHLNSSGAIYYTSLLIDNIKTKLKISSNVSNNNSLIVPAPPSINTNVVVEPEPTIQKIDFDKYMGEPNNDYQEYFEYKLVGSSYQITKIKNEYKDVEQLILPSTYNGKNITTIVENALYGCINLKELYIGFTYKVFEENCFNGCISLEKIYLFETDGNKISPSSTGLLNGTSRNVKIYIPQGANYLSGYTWINYSSYFKYYERNGE